MKTLSRTTKWRLKNGKSPGLGSDYHNPSRNYDFKKIDPKLIKKITISRLSALVPGYMINTYYDDAYQEACLSVASGKSAWSGITRAIDKAHPLRRSKKMEVSNYGNA